MKVVIDVPEKYLNSNIIDVTLITGANGTITDVNIEDEYTEFQTIPKGHGDLIDRNELAPKIHGVKSIVAVLDAPIIIKADK